MAIIPNDLSALKTEKYVLCYFDIIGTKYYLSKDPSFVYSYLWGIQHSLEQYRNGDNSIIVKCFSDNYVVMIRSDEKDKNNALSRLGLIVGHVFADCLTMFHGYPRGVITYGELHYSPDCIIGPALVKAYEVEQKECLFPRILIDESVFNFNPKDDLKLSEKKLFFRDIDGRIVLNSLACISKDELNFLIPSLIGGVLNLSSDSFCKKDPSVFVKYDWLQDYITEYLSITGLQVFPKANIRR